eukprot:TRINITY_DN4307_c1_g1_i2.p2 TRINITY_DN4307_c1_g1~~TRINITY_DN4307_c1_g1_i2.p2  ORF type:complete len:154 (+),score=41.48 TRINITY_DN4307_c1_g1_i2:107-568(+)
MTLKSLKVQLVGAAKGHSLLKRKSDALTLRFRSIVKEVAENKQLMGAKLKDSVFSLTQAKFAAGDFTYAVTESVTAANTRVKMMTENVAGVLIPVFEQHETGNDSQELLGMASGGAAINRAKENWHESLDGKLVREEKWRRRVGRVGNREKGE